MPYSKERAEGAVEFISLLKHTKAKWAGKPFILEKWEDRIVRDVFGTVGKDGKRQYRTVYIEVARKNGKTTLAAAIALLMLFVESHADPESEIYSAAADRDQASLVFNQGASMTRKDPALLKRCNIIDSQKRIVYYPTGSFYRAIAADAPTAHGFNASCVIVDELHAQKKRDLVEALITSQAAREEPLTIFLTTAGYDFSSICYEYHEYARQVLTGVIRDDTFYPVIYAADQDDDWDKVGTWRKANPNLGVTVTKEFIRKEVRTAKKLPAYQNAVRRLHLNQWVQQAVRWIDMALWDGNDNDVVDEESLFGRTCYGGLDLSSVSDITAWVMVFPRDDDPDVIDVVARFWCPEARLTDDTNRYRQQYEAWAREGFLQVTPGNAVDYAFVKAQILEDAQRFNLVDLNIDRLFQGYQVGAELAEEGLTVVGMGQGFLSMAAPMKELERRLLEKRIRHGGNPVLRFMADSVVVKQDPAGNLKPDKASSQARIDGIVALVMALDRMVRHAGEDKRSVYEDRGVLSF